MSGTTFSRGASHPRLNGHPVQAASRQELRLGIAITTFNRRNTVVDLVHRIRQLTTDAFDLVICDDGSTDNTVDALRNAGETVIAGFNRGIAWNKNRGLFYLLNVVRSDIILLIDDDILPTKLGWQQEWVTATWAYGHINNAPVAFRDSLIGGSCTAADPGLATAISGWAFAYSRIALASIGFLDIRFGRYGHEHSDFSFRAIRAGFGGMVFPRSGGKTVCFYVIEGGIIGVPSTSSGTQAELETNGRLLAQFGSDPTYRHAWRTDDEMRIFLEEINETAADATLAFQRDNVFDPARYLELNPDVAAADLDPARHYIGYGRRENRPI